MMSNNKGKEEEDNTKENGKVTTYELQYDIESSVDLNSILEEKHLNAKIKFTMR